MVYLAYAIAAETGDLSFLDKEISFLGTDLVTPAGSATLWEHLLRGVDFTEKHLGAHGLPLILFSDWNDHLGPFGRKGKGESIMVSQQHIFALRQLAELAEARGESADQFRMLMLIDPSIPAEWDSFTMERTYRDCRLTIQVENPDHVQHGFKEMRVDGVKIDLKNGPLLTERILKGRSKASVQVTMGI